MHYNEINTLDFVLGYSPPTTDMNTWYPIGRICLPIVFSQRSCKNLTVTIAQEWSSD